MSKFDPAAATQAYLSALPPEVHAKASEYTHGREWQVLWGWLVALLVSWLIVRTGILSGLRNKVEGGGRVRKPMLAALIVVPTYLVLSTIFSLPWDVYSGWWYEKSFGLTSQAFSGWMTEHLMGALIGLFGGTIFFLILYFLIKIAPKRWWLWGGLATSALSAVAILLAPIYIEPLFNKYTPAPPGQVRDEVVALGKATGTPTDKIFIYNGSKQSNRYTANVSGLGGSARVAMSDVMFQKGADIAEVRGVVGHEMGHYVRQHSLWFLGVITVLAMLAFWLAQRMFATFARLMGSDARDVGDPAGLPVLAAVIATLSLLLTPVLNSVSRYTENDADMFSLKHANEPDGLAKALVKTLEYRAATPAPWEEIVFYDHPSVSHRVRTAMDWKAAHMKPDAEAAAQVSAPAESAPAQSPPEKAKTPAEKSPG